MKMYYQIYWSGYLANKERAWAKLVNMFIKAFGDIEEFDPSKIKQIVFYFKDKAVELKIGISYLTKQWVHISCENKKDLQKIERMFEKWIKEEASSSPESLEVLTE